MTASNPLTVGHLVTVLPSVYVGAAGTALPEAGMALVERVVVDSNSHVPDMFEITLRDFDQNALTSTGIAVGEQIEVWAGAPSGSSAKQLILGEVTSIEGAFDRWLAHTIVRGYTKDHRLQRVRRSRTFINMKDSDIARQVASHAGLVVGEIQETRATHDHVAQVNQTDWEFLAWRARAIGYEFGITDGKFVFGKAVSATGAGARPPVPLVYPQLLREFRPRVSAGNLGTETEVRVWDPLAAKVVSAKTETSSGSVGGTGTSPAKLGRLFTPSTPQPAETGNPAMGNLGPAPSEQGQVVSNWPLAVGAAIDSAADEAMAGVSEHVGSTFAEAEGEAVGDPSLVAGAVLDISGVPDTFCGKWVVTSARHVLDREGYHTFFTVSGRQQRSILALASAGAARPAPPAIPGLVCGIVSSLGDPLKKGRVKVVLPWLSPGFESDWAIVAQVGGGKRAGGMFLPEVGDEVLVGFEFGDPHRPYVLGGVVNNNSTYQVGGPPVETTGQTADVVWRGFCSPSGNRLAFHDQLPPGNGQAPPKASDLVLGTKNAELALTIDQVAGAVVLSCKPAPPDSKASAGHLTIQCGDNGTIDISTGQGGTINVNAGAALEMKAQTSVKIESSGPVEIKGNPIKLN
jgi:phage protein D